MGACKSKQRPSKSQYKLKAQITENEKEKEKNVEEINNNSQVSIKISDQKLNKSKIDLNEELNKKLTINDSQNKFPEIFGFEENFGYLTSLQMNEKLEKGVKLQEIIKKIELKDTQQEFPKLIIKVAKLILSKKEKIKINLNKVIKSFEENLGFLVENNLDDIELPKIGKKILERWLANLLETYHIILFYERDSKEKNFKFWLEKNPQSGDNDLNSFDSQIQNFYEMSIELKTIIHQNMEFLKEISINFLKNVNRKVLESKEFKNKYEEINGVYDNSISFNSKRIIHLEEEHMATFCKKYILIPLDNKSKLKRK